MSVLNKGKVELSKRRWGGSALQSSFRKMVIGMQLQRVCWQGEMREHSWGQNPICLSLSKAVLMRHT